MASCNDKSSSSTVHLDPFAAFTSVAESQQSFNVLCELVCKRSTALLNCGFGFAANAKDGRITVTQIDAFDMPAAARNSAEGISSLVNRLKDASGAMTLLILFDKKLGTEAKRYTVVINWQEYALIETVLKTITEAGIAFTLRSFVDRVTRINPMMNPPEGGFARRTVFSFARWESCLVTQIQAEVQSERWTCSLAMASSSGLLDINTWSTREGKSLCTFLCATIYNTWLQPNAPSVRQTDLFADCDFVTLRNIVASSSSNASSSPSVPTGAVAQGFVDVSDLIPMVSNPGGRTTIWVNVDHPDRPVIGNNAPLSLEPGAVIVEPCLCCMTRPREICVAACGHISTCAPCSKELKSCPSCRGPVAVLIKVFFP
jgi:hypothetical protein